MHGGVAVVTGAASGIGAALARELDRRGARVALCDVDGARLESASAGLRDPLLAEVDVADADAMRAFGERVLAERGTPVLAIANAGVNLSGDFLHGTDEDWRWIVDINLWGVVHTARAFVPPMVEARAGRFVAVSSILGIIGVPNQTAYCATKAAVRGFAESLGQELRPSGVEVSCVHPGGVATNIVRGGRMGETVLGLTRTRAEKVIDRGMPPERAARIVLDGCAAGKRRILVGNDARMLDLLQRLLPTRYRDVVAWGSKVL